jgi:hypothetical protein
LPLDSIGSSLSAAKVRFCGCPIEIQRTEVVFNLGIPLLCIFFNRRDRSPPPVMAYGKQSMDEPRLHITYLVSSGRPCWKARDRGKDLVLSLPCAKTIRRIRHLLRLTHSLTCSMKPATLPGGEAGQWTSFILCIDLLFSLHRQTVN